MTEPLVVYEKPAEHAASITLNRPEALNAINVSMRDDLWTYINAALLDPDVRVLIFRGVGRAALGETM